MYTSLAITGLFAAWASALTVPRSSDELSDGRPTLAFTRHPLLGGAPVPTTPEERAAAKKPDYLYWFAAEQKKRDILAPRFELAEHAYLGDMLVLQGPDGQPLPRFNKFKLPNSVQLTYGEINCLAGDFYGTYNPISNGKDQEQQVQFFLDAYSWLATDTSRQPGEVTEILKIAQQERTEFAAAVANGSNPSAMYAQLPDRTTEYEKVTFTRTKIPGYLGLASINFDHFGADARTAYNAGHLAALRVAAKGDLLTAYTLNAFADHFLEDSFAAGHLRTPRRLLHDTLGDRDLCAKAMHDEDNALGLKVTNPLGQTWMSHGDKYLMDHDDTDNVNMALNALQASAGEIYVAWQSKGFNPDPAGFRAWQYAPTLASAESKSQVLAPLFTASGPQRRDDIEKRTVWKFTNIFTYLTTLAQIKASGMWNYPMCMSGKCHFTSV